MHSWSVLLVNGNYQVNWPLHVLQMVLTTTEGQVEHFMCCPLMKTGKTLTKDYLPIL